MIINLVIFGFNFFPLILWKRGVNCQFNSTFDFAYLQRYLEIKRDGEKAPPEPAGYPFL